MAQLIRDVMTPSPLALQASTTVFDAARTMRDSDIGNVLVVDDGEGVCGIVTDRDIVVRAIAEGLDPSEARLADICTRDVTTVDADASVDEAARVMRDGALRRVPVVEDGAPVGIVSLGDLAVEQDPSSALAGISAAPPNR
jgi:CBS domain-containing protein